MTVDSWIHVAELIIVVVFIPTMKTGVGVLISLRDAVRGLTTAVENAGRTIDDHEERLRYIERNGYERRTGVERRSGVNGLD